MSTLYFPTKPNGVPILSYARIDEIAENLVREVQPELFTTQVDATNLSLVMKHLQGWQFAGRYLSANGSLLGLACHTGGTTLIYDEYRKNPEPFQVPPHSILIDRSLFRKENEKLFRFTLGHEIGHALFHEAFSLKKENMEAYREESRERMIADRASALGIREHRLLKTSYDWIEWQANAFASALLMPRSLVEQVKDLLYEDDTPYMEFLNELCITVMDVFKVSHTAAFYRLKELAIAPEGCRVSPNGVLVR